MELVIIIKIVHNDKSIFWVSRITRAPILISLDCAFEPLRPTVWDIIIYALIIADAHFFYRRVLIRLGFCEVDRRQSQVSCQNGNKIARHLKSDPDLSVSPRNMQINSNDVARVDTGVEYTAVCVVTRKCNYIIYSESLRHGKTSSQDDRTRSATTI